MKKSILVAVLLAAGVAAGAQEDPDPAIPRPEETPTATQTPAVSPAPAKPKPARPDAYREYKAGNHEKAVAICLNEIKETPGNRDSYVVLGWALVASGRYAEAFDYTRMGIERTGQDQRFTDTAEESLSKLYVSFYSQGRHDDAITTIQRFLSFLPNSSKAASAYGLLGEIYLKKGYFIYADTAFSYALRSNRASFAWWLGAGLAREKTDDYRSALVAYGEALKIDPGQQEALRGRDRMREKLSLAPSASAAP